MKDGQISTTNAGDLLLGALSGTDSGEIEAAPLPRVERPSLFLGGHMSNVYDAQGNILNPVGPGCRRYTNADATEIDWFATHPRPVEKTQKGTEIPAILPPNSGDTPKVRRPRYEDENGKMWLYNDATKEWDIPEPTIDVTIPATIGEHTE